jgi:hypothetical protein
MSDSTFACDVIAKNCRLQSLSFILLDSRKVSPNMKLAFLNLLQSQVLWLKELFLCGQHVDGFFDESLPELWKILAQIRQLSKLQWAGHPLRHLGICHLKQI